VKTAVLPAAQDISLYAGSKEVCTFPVRCGEALIRSAA